jgi:tetratricopeptide (TPR) repeat protein
LRVRTLTHKARVLERYLRYEEALGTLEQAERLAENVDVVTQAGVWNARGTLMAYAVGEAEPVEELAQRAMEALAGLNSLEARVERANALNNLGVATWLTLKLDLAEEYPQQALGIRREIGNTNQIAISLLNFGLAMRENNNPQAEQHLMEAIDLLEETDQLANLARAHNAMGYLKVKQAQYPLAQQHFERAVALSRSLGEDYVLPDFVNNLGLTFFFQNSYEQARDYFAEATLKKASALNNQSRAMYYCNKAEAELCLGLLEDAKLSVGSAFDLLHGKASVWWTDAHYFQAECAVLENALEDARSSYQAALEAACTFNNAAKQATVLSRLATLDLDLRIAQQAVDMSDSPISRAALQAASKKFPNAIKTIQAVNSAYEEGRLMVDIARHTKDQKMLEKGFSLLKLPFRAG